ncbi:MAG TPA: PKD domain-containing protein [Thermoplasmata archaeon]|nr:PKD domain-containing protein [Thermoplasmata archaeon]
MGRIAALLVLGIVLLGTLGAMPPADGGRSHAGGPGVPTVLGAGSARASPDISPYVAGVPPRVNWFTYRNNPERTGANFLEHTIAPSNVSELQPLWSIPSNGSDFSAPIVVNGTVYYGSWNGEEYAVDAATGRVEWKDFLGTDPCGYAPQGVSSTPEYVNGSLYLGGGGGLTSDPDWYALNATTGSVEWQYLVGPDTTNYYNWASALTYHGSLYIGVSSCFDNPLVPGQLREVNLTGNHAASHVFDTVPTGEDGGSIWTTPAVDPTANTVWITTGNEASGYPPFVNAIIGLNATTLNLSGSWQVPNVTGQDSDFGSTPTLLTTPSGIPLVVASNKNGLAYALNRSNVTTHGPWAPIWSLDTGGGFSSGAYDGHTLYLGGSALYAVDPDNGTVDWTTPLPAGGIVGGLTYANGLVFGGAGSDVYAVDAANGTILWNGSLPGGELMLSEPVVTDGQLYAASGDYGAHGNLTAFGLPFSANATATPLNGSTPLAVHFSASAHGGMTPYTYAWEFGDGVAGSGPSPTHTYARGGNFTAVVWVNDSADGSATFTFPIRPLGVTLAASPDPDPAHEAVSFSAVPVGGFPPYSYLWAFGEGTSGATLRQPTHTYSAPGNYSVSVSVTDALEHEVSADLRLPVAYSSPLSAAPTYSYTGGVGCSGGPGSPVQLHFSANALGGSPPLSDNWTFSDGTTASGAAVTITPSPAISFANLTVRDAQGQVYTTSILVGPDVTMCPVQTLSDTGYILWGLGLGIAALVLVLALVVVRFRRRPPPEGTREP